MVHVTGSFILVNATLVTSFWITTSGNGNWFLYLVTHYIFGLLIELWAEGSMFPLSLSLAFVKIWNRSVIRSIY